MPLFSKPSPEMVYDLVNEANPTLPIPLSAANAKFGVPAAATVPGNATLNTAIQVISASNDYIGRKPVNYRRLSLTNLFRGMTVQINKYSANQGAAGSVVFTVYNLLPIINATYGLNLTTDDITDVGIPRGNTQENGFYTTTVTVNAKATSLGWIGSFQLKWRGAPQELESMITVTDLAARLFPGGNDFSGAHQLVVNNMAYPIDWSSFMVDHKWDGYPGNPVPGGNTPAFFNAAIDLLNSMYGKSMPYGSNNAPAYAYSSWGPTVIDLTVPANQLLYPEANFAYYNRVLIATPPTAEPAQANIVGRHYFHFNV